MFLIYSRKMPNPFFGDHHVNHCEVGVVRETLLIRTHPDDDNLRGSLPHINAVVTPETLQCVRAVKFSYNSSVCVCVCVSWK